MKALQVGRRTFLGALWAVLGGALPPADAATGKVARIGVIVPSRGDVNEDFVGGLRRELRRLNWIDGENLAMEIRWDDGSGARIAEFAAELRASNVALIVTRGTSAIRAARDAVPDVPIVMSSGGDPVGTGLVKSLDRPGGNVTGMSLAGQEIIPKALELLAEAVPSLKRVTILMNASNPANGFIYQSLTSRARGRGLLLERFDVSEPAQLDAVVRQAEGGGMLIIGDPLLGTFQQRLAQLALNARVPTVFTLNLPLYLGALMSYAADSSELLRGTARFIDRILKGAKPADLPIEQPTAFRLAINLRTAEALGLALPKALVMRANETVR